VDQQADRDVKKPEENSIAVLPGAVSQITHPIAGEFQRVPDNNTARGARRKF